jgi:cytochrome c553
MPLKKRSDPVGKYLSDDEMRVLAEWIRQGAKDN